MTYKEKKSKIADILMDFQEEYSNDVINRPMLASLYAGNILSFIDSMQKEPVNEDLEEAAKRYSTEGDEISGLYIIDEEVEAFKAGAQWQKEQMMAKAVDGKVIANGMGNPILHLWDKGRHLIDKKVKVIIIKED